jgi:hypothetical protein
MGNAKPLSMKAGVEKKKFIIMACCCVCEIVERSRPAPSAVIRNSTSRTAAAAGCREKGVWNTRSATLLISTTSSRPTTANGSVLPSIRSIGSASPSIVPWCRSPSSAQSPSPWHQRHHHDDVGHYVRHEVVAAVQVGVNHTRLLAFRFGNEVPTGEFGLRVSTRTFCCQQAARKLRDNLPRVTEKPTLPQPFAAVLLSAQLARHPQHWHTERSGR